MASCAYGLRAHLSSEYASQAPAHDPYIISGHSTQIRTLNRACPYPIKRPVSLMLFFFSWSEPRSPSSIDQNTQHPLCVCLSPPPPLPSLSPSFSLFLSLITPDEQHRSSLAGSKRVHRRHRRDRLRGRQRHLLCLRLRRSLVSPRYCCRPCFAPSRVIERLLLSAPR